MYVFICFVYYSYFFSDFQILIIKFNFFLVTNVFYHSRSYLF